MQVGCVDAFPPPIDTTNAPRVLLTGRPKNGNPLLHIGVREAVARPCTPARRTSPAVARDQRGEVRRLVVRQGMSLTLIAVALGMAAALALAKFSASFLYGVRPHDLVTFTGVPLFLAVISFLACWIPSRRAARVDPLTALRHD